MAKPLQKLWVLGLVAILVAWIVILTSWYINPWFRFFEHAFSDLGGPDANKPWLYNYGLIATGLLVVGYSIGLYHLSRVKMEVVGASFIFIAGVFLSLIGVYPSGTRPHVFVSSWFFIQMDLAIIAIGIGLIKRGSKLGKYVLAIGLASPVLFLLVEKLAGWPSVAVGEAYGILAIDLAIVLASIEYRRFSLLEVEASSR